MTEGKQRNLDLSSVSGVVVDHVFVLQDDLWMVRIGLLLLHVADLVLLVFYLSQWDALGAAAVPS